MNYDSDWSGLEKGWFDRWLNFEKDSGFAGRVVTGVGAFLNYPEETLAQINRALAPSPQGNRVLGIAIYSYGSTSVYGPTTSTARPTSPRGCRASHTEAGRGTRPGSPSGRRRATSGSWPSFRSRM